MAQDHSPIQAVSDTALMFAQDHIDLILAMRKGIIEDRREQAQMMDFIGQDRHRRIVVALQACRHAPEESILHNWALAMIAADIEHLHKKADPRDRETLTYVFSSLPEREDLRIAFDHAAQRGRSSIEGRIRRAIRTIFEGPEI